MNYWIRPLGIGLIGIVLVGLSWFLPSILPEQIFAAMLQPSYRLEELVGQFVPEVVMAFRRAFTTAAVAAFVGFLFWFGAVRLARPTGPGQVGQGWRKVIWLLLLTFVLLSATGATYSLLTYWINTVDVDAATRWTGYVGVTSAFTFWLLSLIGTEPMMRPAVPLASRLVLR